MGCAEWKEADAEVSLASASSEAAWKLEETRRQVARVALAGL